MGLTAEQCRQLTDDGYVVLRQFMDAKFLGQLRRATEAQYLTEGDQAGAEFKQEKGCRRLANLVDKGAAFQRVISEPRILNAVGQVLGSEFKLSSLNARSVNPQTDLTQPLHADMAAVADEQGFWVCNVIWMLDELTPDNGAPRIIPGSHGWRCLPQDKLSELTAPHPDEVLVTGLAGDVAVMNAHAWHGGLPNKTDHPRTALHAFYCRRDKPQQQYQKRMLRSIVQETLSDELRWLLALDDPDNDRISSDVAVRSGFMK